MILQVHDELVFECPVSEKTKIKSLVRAEMENAYKLLEGILNGEGRGSYHPEYGQIYWEFEEISFLKNILIKKNTCFAKYFGHKRVPEGSHSDVKHTSGSLSTRAIR